jgi:hypothetical protein
MNNFRLITMGNCRLKVNSKSESASNLNSS